MLIELNNLKPAYLSDKQVSDSQIYLQESVVFEKEKRYVIEAGSGKGKSSLLNIIYGVHEKYEGALHYHGIKKDQIKKDQISYVFQDLKLFKELTALENVLLKNNLTQHKEITVIKELFNQFGLSKQLNQSAATLSLGQKQRVAIIRSLCMPYKLLLMDEPYSHLDDDNMKIIMEIIKNDALENGASIIIASLGNSAELDADQILQI